MNESQRKATADNTIYAHADALIKLCDQLETRGLSALDDATLESIPTILSSASSALASARSHDLQSPLVTTLETQLFRCSELLRKTQRSRLRGLGRHVLRTLPRHLSGGLLIQGLALLFIVCGFALGYRTTDADTLRVLSFFPHGWGGFELSEQVQALAQPEMVQLWLLAPPSDIAMLLVSLDAHLVAFFLGFVTAALLLVGCGGIFTPLILLAFGGSFGALFGVLPSAQSGEVWWRLFPAMAMFSLALALAQSAGFSILRSWIPDREGRKEQHRARYLQGALIQATTAFLHMLCGLLFTWLLIRSDNAERTAATLTAITMVWMLGYAVYVGVLGHAHQIFPARYASWFGGDASLHPDLPYSEPPPPVYRRSLVLDLREGASVRVTLAPFNERLGAFAIDSIVLLVWLVLTHFFVERIFAWNDALEGPQLAGLFAFLLFPMLLYVFLTEWRWQGQTVGKRIFEIRTIRLDGERLDPWTMALRSMMLSVETTIPMLLILLSYVAAQRMIWGLFGIGFLITLTLHLYPLLNVYGQRIGDRMTGTITIAIPDTATGVLPPPPIAHDAALDLPQIQLTAYQRDILAALRTRVQAGETDAARSTLRTLLKDDRFANAPDQEMLAALDTLYAQAHTSARRKPTHTSRRS